MISLEKILFGILSLALLAGISASAAFTEIAAGVAVFLFGMVLLETGFKAFTGGVLERLLAITTDRTWKSLGFGIITTTLMQSSSLVSVIAISFLSAGLIGLQQGIGIIFGANLGTTTGAWLIAGLGMKVKISAYAMPLLVFGAFFSLQASRHLKGLGQVLAGIGFLFLGIDFMKEGFATFQGNIDLTRYALEGVGGLLLYALIGAVATVVMQSSHATLVLTIAALAAGQITYSNGLALAIGANVGTTITAVIGAVSADIQGRRLAAAHVIFNLATGIVALVAIVPLQWLVDALATQLGIAADNYTLKLALFHSIFNLIGIVMMLPLIERMVRFLCYVLPEPEYTQVPDLQVVATEPVQVRAKGLSDASLLHPDASLKAVILEVNNLVDSIVSVIAYGLFLQQSQVNGEDSAERPVLPATAEGFDRPLASLYELEIKGIYSDIIEFSARAQIGMSPAQFTSLFELKQACLHGVEAYKNILHLHKNMARYLFSDHEVIRQEYTLLRENLALVLRTVYQINQLLPKDNAGAGHRGLMAIDRVRLKLEKDDVIKSGHLDQLLIDRQLSGMLATSLLNDAHYMSSACHSLLLLAERILGVQSSGAETVNKALLLDEAEIADVIERADDVHPTQS